MNGCYAYCVLPQGRPPPAALRGVDGAAVHGFDVAGVTLWFSSLPARPEPALARIREHNAVVEAAADARVTPVPLRFGQWLPDDATLARHAQERAPAWRAQLAAFTGCCEFGVRLRLPDAAPARDVQSTERQGGVGRAYMERLAARQARTAAQRASGEQAVAALRAQLSRLVLRERVEFAGVDVSIAHLVARAEEARYRGAIAAVSARLDAELTITGPWPPYSFVE